jgi:hypothetical protein
LTQIYTKLNIAQEKQISSLPSTARRTIILR